MTGKKTTNRAAGGCWTTERSGEAAELYEKYTMDQKTGGKTVEIQWKNSEKRMPPKAAVKQIMDELAISTVSVNTHLPYGKLVYDLEERSSNAKRIEEEELRRKDNADMP